MSKVQSNRWVRRVGVGVCAFAVMVGVAPMAAQERAATAAAVSKAYVPQTPQGPTLRLSMKDAETMAVETNLGLKQARINSEIAAQNIVSARASFLPAVRANVNRNTSDSQTQSVFESSGQIVSKSSGNYSASVGQALPWYGSSYNVSWSGNRSTTNQLGSTFNPTTGSTFSFGVTQPILRNFKTDNNRARLETNQLQQLSTDLQVQQQIVGLQSSVRSAYLGLIAAIEGRKVAQKIMDVSQESLRSSRTRVSVGAGAQIDTIQSEAAVASNEEALITADAAIASAQDQLRTLVLDPARPDYWMVQFEPTDTIQLTPQTVDVDAAIKNALENRLDLLVLKQSVRVSDVNAKVLKNQTLPDVSGYVNYSASGTGGTQLQYDPEAFPPVVIGSTTRGFGTVLGDAFGGTFPNWTVGVQIAYPIGKTAVQAALAQQQLSRKQQDLQLQDMQLQIVAEVRQAARNVETAFQRVQATQKAKDANQKQLDAEERRFTVGMSTNFDVLQKQTFLASALNAELRAMIAYNQALIDLERVQRIR